METFAFSSLESEKGQGRGLRELGNWETRELGFNQKRQVERGRGLRAQRLSAEPSGVVSAGRGQAVSGWGTGSPSAAWTSGLHAAPAYSFTHLWGPQEKEQDFWIWVSAAPPPPPLLTPKARQGRKSWCSRKRSFVNHRLRRSPPLAIPSNAGCSSGCLRACLCTYSGKERGEVECLWLCCTLLWTLPEGF